MRGDSIQFRSVSKTHPRGVWNHHGAIRPRETRKVTTDEPSAKTRMVCVWFFGSSIAIRNAASGSAITALSR